MNIVISKEGVVRLEESDTFSAFKIVAHTGITEEKPRGLCDALARLGEPDGEDHVWVSANELIMLSCRKEDRVWLEGFEEMLSLGRKYGFVKEDPVRVRAHVQWEDIP